MTLNALYFTLLQSVLSSLGAICFGVILAIGFSRFRFRGQRFLEAFCYLPFFLPPLAVVLSVIALYGRQGLNLPVFGLFGILMAHWIFNIPVVLFFLRRAYQSVPKAQVILATQAGEVWRLIDCDVLRRVLPTAFAIVFLYASLSFTIVLTLGRGLSVTTLELSIYQAIRYDLNLILVAKLALLQMAFGLIVYVLARNSFETDWPEASQDFQLPKPNSVVLRFGLVFFFICTLLILAAPLIEFSINASSGIFQLFEQNGLFEAAWNSIKLGLMSVLICQFIAAVMIYYQRDSLAWLIGATSPLVLAVAVILCIRPFANPFSYGVVFVALFQALAMLPLIVSTWRGCINKVSNEERRLMKLLMPKKVDQLKRFWWPHCRGTGIETSVLIVALSIGDLALMPLFAPSGFETLPVLIWQMIGSYRYEMASALSLLVLVAIFVLLGIVQLWNAYEGYNDA